MMRTGATATCTDSEGGKSRARVRAVNQSLTEVKARLFMSPGMPADLRGQLRSFM